MAPQGPSSQRRLLRWGIVGLAVLVALIAWLFTRDSSSDFSTEPSSQKPDSPRIATLDELRQVSADMGQPIYWAGPIDGKELVFSELKEGGAQVLYSPEGTEAEESSPKSLTVGSYPLPNPEQALEKFAERPSSTSRRASDGREVVFSTTAPSSVYFASPDNSVQVEVYDASPKRALSLALSGKVEPVG